MTLCLCGSRVDGYGAGLSKFVHAPHSGHCSQDKAQSGVGSMDAPFQQASDALRAGGKC